MKQFHHQFSTSVCRPPPISPAVTVLDVSSTVGAILALLLKQNPHVTELRIYDENKDTYMMADDLNVIDTQTRVVPFSCKSLKEAIKDAHVVISTGGCQSKPGLSQKQLFEQNIDNVRNVAIFLSEFNPTAVYCIAKPPVEALVPLASEEYKKAECYNPRKIIGITTYASMVANTFIARYLRVDPEEVMCPIVGGLAPKSTIPVISHTKPSVEYNSKVYLKLQEDIANAEETLLRKGATWCFSKAAAISRFINLLLEAIKGDKKCAECAFVAQTGHIGKFLPYMTSIVKLGPEGVSSTHMPKINELEITRLKSALPHILENIFLGQTYLNGEFSLPPQFRTKRRCDVHLKQKLKERNIRSGITC
ncbi:malate dehydrogenase, mitochondrial [Asbolus verrucosus]|uniref:Malate dehydrogenase, mitochondrial n=1 Tax=Asbolus verrucosus TaxID=1661398 RepID=A0A482W4U7_ASBVE|nr:malate dehydrogenase, mitochondrial [Asbolus verrucosus]